MGLGILLAVVVAEALLWVASAMVGSYRSRASARDGRVILTLGDSHTYGVHYEAGETYPGQLQSRLDTTSPGRFQVVNLGLPGMNSSELVANFPAWAKGTRPWASVVCIGINNLWNSTATEHSPEGRPSLLGRSRLLRLGLLLKHEAVFSAPIYHERPVIERSIDDSSGEVTHVDAESGRELIRHQRRQDGDLALEEGVVLLRRDLLRLVTLHRTYGTQLLFLSYAPTPIPGQAAFYSHHDAMSETMRAVAEAEGVPFIDVRPVFAKRLRETGGERAVWFHTERNGHPNPRGYGLVAEAVAQAISQLEEVDD